MKKKIIVCSNSAWNIHNFRLELMEYLRILNYEIIAVAPWDEYAREIIKKKFKFVPVNMNRKGINPIKDLKLMYDLYRIYNKEKPDLILHYTIKFNIYGTLAAHLLRIRSIAVLTGLGYVFLNKNILHFLSKLLYKFSFKFVNRAIFQNKDDLNLFLQEKIIDKEKTKVILGSGVNTDYFSPKSNNKKNKQFTYIFIGRLLKDKGIMEYLQAAEIVKKKCPLIQFIVLGNIDKGNPASISQRLLDYWIKKINIEHYNFTKDVRKYLCKSDVLVLPTYYGEGIPRALLEASSMTKPAITTKWIGCKEVIEHNKNGFLVPPKDPKALAKAMMKMMALPAARRKAMGKYSRQKIIKNFSNKVIFKQYYNAIKETLNIQGDYTN